MTTTRKFLTALALPILLIAATAPAHAANPGGTHVQVAFADWDDFDNGINLAGSFHLPDMEQLRLFAGYTNTDLEHIRLGAGWIVPMQDDFSLEFGGSYNYFDVGPFDDSGLGLHGIVRFAPMPELILSGKLEYILMDDLDNEVVLGFDVNYRFHEQVSGFLNYSLYDEIDNNLLLLGARFNF